MGKLSKEAEGRIFAAVEKSAELLQQGAHPNDALAKAASACGVPRGYINLLVNAFNIGQTNRQRETGTTVLEKLADVALADTPGVEAILYPAVVKTAAAIEHDTAVSIEYFYSPASLLEKRASQQAAARQIDPRQLGEHTITAPEPYPRDPKDVLRKTAGEVSRLQRAVEELRRQSSAALDKMACTFSALTGYFRQPNCIPLPVVAENAAILHGEPARQLMDKVAQVTPGLTKLAHNKMQLRSSRDLAAKGLPYDLVAQFLVDTQAYNDAQTKYAAALAAAEKQAEGLLRPFAEPSRSSSVLEEFFPTEKTALFGTDLLRSALGSLASSVSEPRSPSALVQSQLQKLNDPNYEQELRDVRTEAMLQYLMQNDPEISGYEPDEVLSAFNEISDVAPQLSDQMLPMRTLLKKRLSGELDTHEIGQLLDIAEKVRSRDEASQSELKQRELAQSQQQHGERMNLDTARFRAEKARSKAELAQRKSEARAHGEEFKKTHELATAQRGDQRRRDAWTQGMDLRRAIHENSVLNETHRHNLTGEGESASSLWEAGWHPLPQGEGLPADSRPTPRHRQRLRSRAVRGSRAALETNPQGGRPRPLSRRAADLDARSASLPDQQSLSGGHIEPPGVALWLSAIAGVPSGDAPVALFPCLVRGILSEPRFP